MSGEQKPKKPIYKKWWFWVIVVCLVGAAGSGLSDGGESGEPPVVQTEVQTLTSSTLEPSETPEDNPAETMPENDPDEATPEPVESESPEPPQSQESETSQDVSEEDKETAKSLDAEILSICTMAEQDYNAFLSLVSTEGTTNLDAYNAAKTLGDNLTTYNYRQLSNISGSDLEEFKKYKENASLYIYTMSEVAEAAMVYLDDAKTSNLSAYQEATENVSNYLLPLVASRLTFLSAAGFSDDEIGVLVDTPA